MMKRLALLAALSLGDAQAQGVMTLNALCGLMNTSRVQVVAYLPSIESPVLAECLRQATVDYRRNVMVLTVPYFAQSSRSYVFGLTLAGIQMFEANVNSTVGVVLVDGTAYTAPSLGMSDNAVLTVQNLVQTRVYAQWFNKALKVAKSMSPVDAMNRLRR